MIAQRASNEVKIKSICDGHHFAQHSGDYKCKRLPLQLKTLKLASFRQNMISPPLTDTSSQASRENLLMNLYEEPQEEKQLHCD